MNGCVPLGGSQPQQTAQQSPQYYQQQQQSAENNNKINDLNQQCVTKFHPGFYYDATQMACLPPNGKSWADYSTPVDQNAVCREQFPLVKDIYYDAGQNKCLPPGGSWEIYAKQESTQGSNTSATSVTSKSAKLVGDPKLEGFNGLSFTVDVSEVKSDFEKELNSPNGYNVNLGPASRTVSGHTITVSSWGFTFKSTDTNKLAFTVYGNDVLFDGSPKGNKTLHGSADYYPSTALVKGNIGYWELVTKGVL